MPDQDPLAQLNDIHLPSAIGLWPPAWGWWLLLLAIVALLALSIYIINRKKSRNAYRALALKELQKIQQKFTHEQRGEYLQAISLLLRRTALSGFGSTFNASLKGDAWLQWLDAQNPKAKQPFYSSVGKVLILGPYQKQPDINQDQLHAMVEAWIQQHRNQWQQSSSKNNNKNNNSIHTMEPRSDV